MIPIQTDIRKDLWRRPEFLPGLAQYWGDERDEPVPIRAKRTEPTRATIHLGLYKYRWEPDPKDHPVFAGMVNLYGHRDLIVQRALVFHDEDYSDTGCEIRDRLDSHKGDSECFITVFREDYKPVLLLTRSHDLFLAYENPVLIDGRLWVEIERGGHGISRIGHAPTLEYLCGKSVRLYMPNVNLAIRDMEGDDFKGWEPEYRRMFAEWGLDWPIEMGDRRVEVSRWYAGDSVGYAWNDPMEFAYRLWRCCGKKETWR